MTKISRTPRESGMDPATKKEWVDRINACLGKQCGTIFDTGDTLMEAKRTLPKNAFREVVKATGLLSHSNAANYMRVAQNEYLRKPGIFEYLPAAVGTLIDLACWEPKMLLKAIESKQLHPHATRANLYSWYMGVKMGPRVRSGSPRRKINRKLEEPYTDWIVGYIVADGGYCMKNYEARTARLANFVNKINEADFDVAFVAMTEQSAMHYQFKRQQIEAKIKHRYRMFNLRDFEEEGLDRIFGTYWDFKLQPLRWESWVPKFINAEIDQTAPFLNLKADELRFIRCQRDTRRPFPDPYRAWGPQHASHSLESFMADDEPTRRKHNLERFMGVDEEPLASIETI